MQPFRAATECEVDRARKRAASCNRAQTSDTEQILEIGGRHPNTTPLTRTSPCEVRMKRSATPLPSGSRTKDQLESTATPGAMEPKHRKVAGIAGSNASNASCRGVQAVSDTRDRRPTGPFRA